MPAEAPAPDRPVEPSLQALADQAGIHRGPELGALHPTDFYDALTLTLGKAESLTAHLIQQLDALDEQFVNRPYADSVDPYALSLIAQHLTDHLARLRVQATAWQQFDAQTCRKKGGR